MQIRTWMRERKIEGTHAAIVKRILDNDPLLSAAEKTFREMCVLEALMRNGGNQSAAAKSLGVCLHTVHREVRSLGLTAADFRQVTRDLRARRNAASTSRSQSGAGGSPSGSAGVSRLRDGEQLKH